MIQVLNRALNILEYVAKNPKRPHTLTDIADHLDLNHSTCANIIKTLVSRNYIEQVSKKEGYRLGNMSYYLTNNFSYKTELIDAAKEPMQDLTQETKEGCILAILRGKTRVIIHDEQSERELQVVNYPQKDAYATSTGRLILSYLEEEELKHFVKEYGLPSTKIWGEVDTFEDLLEETSKIRDKEMCIQESKAHIIGIAVPIWRQTKVVASLGIYLPAVRLTEDIRDDIINQLKNAAKQVNENIKKGQYMRSHTSNNINN